MPEPIKGEIAVAMNESGDWIVLPWDDDAAEKMTEDYGFTAMRVAKLTFTMTPPVVPEVDVEIPDDAGETLTAEAEEADEAA